MHVHVDNSVQFVTGYEKRDHLGFFIKIEFLVWIDSSVCVVSRKNIDHKPSYDHFYELGSEC